jgi:outer membrane protein assembly factor BamB
MRCPSSPSLARLALLFALAGGGLYAGETWPQFRGPLGDGVSDASGLPVSFSETNGVKWKTAIHGKAWSSPVIWGNQVWLTTATKDGRELSVLCLDRETGAIQRDQMLFEVEAPQYCHPFNSYASPTPVIEDGRIYVTFGSPGTACLDTASGTKLWERRDFVCNHFRAAGSSPVLHGDLLILHFDGSDRQYVAALDKHTGRTVWQVERSVDYRDLGSDGKPQADGDFRKAFATPHIVHLAGREVIISQGSKATYGYDALTGRELWRLEELTSYSASTRAVAGGGLIFLPTGWARGQLLAIEAGTNAATLDAASPAAHAGTNGLRVVWDTTRNVPKKPSLLLANGLLYAVEDNTGVASCLEAATGQAMWRERLGGNYSASPVLADGRLYFCSEEGKVTVLAAGRDFKPLATNQLGDGFMASPAVAGKDLFLRSRSHLYRLEAP